MKALARIYTITVDGEQMGYKQALQPRPNVSTLSPLGAPMLAGFAKRPIWVDPRTPCAVAVNVWRAGAAGVRTGLTSTSRAEPGRTRSFAKSWALNLANYPSADGWNPSAVINLRDGIERTRKSLAQPASGEPTGSPQAKRSRSDTGPSWTQPGGSQQHPPREYQREPPLPTMSRNFKRARLNEPLTQEAEGVGGASSSSISPPTITGSLNPCSNFGSRGKRETSGRGDAAGSKRAKKGFAIGDLTIHCGVCGCDTPAGVCRYLLNEPWMTEPWKGARPGAAVCRPCYATYCTERA